MSYEQHQMPRTLPAPPPQVMFGPQYDIPPRQDRRRKRLGWGSAAVVASLSWLIGLLMGIGVGKASEAEAPTPTTRAAAPSATAKAKPAPSAAKADGSVSQRNALRAAESYLNMQGFSRAGLINQLSSAAGDGYSKADATWAVDHLSGVNWNEQAVRAGQSYLDMQGFSRSGLIEQLSSSAGDQFTKAQATYAADKLGL